MLSSWTLRNSSLRSRARFDRLIDRVSSSSSSSSSRMTSSSTAQAAEQLPRHEMVLEAEVESTTTTITTTPTTAAKAASSTAGWIALNSERPLAEIRKLVQQRVTERNGWKIHGVFYDHEVPTKQETWNFVRDRLPKQFSFQPPSQAELDEHFPVLPLDWEKIQSFASSTTPAATEHQIQITWLGHSSLLVQMNGCNLLMDPVFSERCSPSQWFGPKRYRPPPCQIRELCEKLTIDLILISHNHYDHLDYTTVREIHQLSPTSPFVVPLGLQQWFRKNVGPQIPVYEQDWHERMAYSKTPARGGGTHIESSSSLLTVTCVPMRHWSNRTGDRDETLWCGYSVRAVGAGNRHSFLFPGDTAWFDGLDDVAKQHGPWDVAAIPIGAYEPRDFMKYNHLNVEEAVCMKDAVQARSAVPIHWGTFPLTTEPVLEPREKLVELMEGRPDAKSFVPWLIGETKQF